MPTQDEISIVDLAVALKDELLLIHREGAALLGDPEAIPILAEFALGPAGETDDCAEKVEELLHKALGRLRRFDRFSASRLKNGLAELLGIGEKPWQTQADRFENASTALSYSSGESLRKTKRKGDDTKWLWEVFLDLLTTQLVAIAVEVGFAPTGRFSDRQSATQTSPISTLPLKYWEPFVEELHWVFVLGFRDAISQDRLLALVQLADNHDLAGDGGSYTKMARLLRFAIHEFARSVWTSSATIAECENTIRDLAKLPGGHVPALERNRNGLLAIDGPVRIEYSIGRFIETSRHGERSIDLAELAKPLARLIKKDPMAESLSRDWEIENKRIKRLWRESVEKASKRTPPP